jgi:hypothetical protein
MDDELVADVAEVVVDDMADDVAIDDMATT